MSHIQVMRKTDTHVSEADMPDRVQPLAKAHHGHAFTGVIGAATWGHCRGQQ